DEHGYVLTAVVNADGVTDHLGHHRAAAAPGLDDAPVARGVGGVDLGEEVAIYERPLLQASRHAYFSFRRRTMKRLDTLRLLRVLRPLDCWPQGLTGGRPPVERPSPPPCGWSTGFIERPRWCGLRPSQRLRPALPRTMFLWSELPTEPTV